MFWRRGLAITGVVAVIGLVIAPPAQAQTVSIQTATTAMTSHTTFSSASATAICGAGTTLVGGGDRLSVAATGAQVTNDGSVTLATNASDSSGNPLASGATDPASWTATGGYSGMAPGTDQVTSFAMCSAGVTSATEVEATAVASSTNNPPAATATCPPGTSLVGGGGFTAFNGSDNTKVVDSYPSDGAGDIPSNGATNPTSWTAQANSNNATGSTTTAVAVCATDVSVPTAVATNSASLTSVTGGTPLPVTVSCPQGTTLLAGGSDINTEGGSGTGGQGIHMVGDFPSDASGNPQSASASSWTVVAMDGGQSLAAMADQAFALCDTTTPVASVPEFPYPALMVVVAGLLGGFALYLWRRRVAA